MSSRHFESGASKRRRKEKQNQELKKYRGLMNEFVINSGVEQKQSNITKSSESISTKNLKEDCSDSNANISTNEQTQPSEKQILSNIAKSSENIETNDLIDDVSDSNGNIKTNEQTQQRIEQTEYNMSINRGTSCSSSIDIPSNEQGLELNLNDEFPTDRGKFAETITNTNLKRQIIMFGPCKPNIKFPNYLIYYTIITLIPKDVHFLQNIILL